MNYTQLLSKFKEHNQEHVFSFWDDLNQDQKQILLDQCLNIDLEKLDVLLNEKISQESNVDEDKNLAADIEPVEYIEYPENLSDSPSWEEAHRVGVEAISRGEVAAFTPAGGQGSRLGFNAPKGLFPISPVSKKSLFQIFAEKILATSNKYGFSVPWYIMTSVENNEPTASFFEANDYFGLDKKNVHFFIQNTMPAVDFTGKILMKSRFEIALVPDGHGGSFTALFESGSIKDMEERGVKYISFFQVDNPLVECIDPYFVGFHSSADSQFSSKVCMKQEPSEKVGILAKVGDKINIIEYSDLSDEMAAERTESGELKFRCGSIGVHVVSTSLASEIGNPEASTSSLPFHVATKKIACIDSNGEPFNPEDKNGYKFEMFGFDALDFVENALVVETKRELEFSPVKNAEGSDSPNTAIRDQLRKYSRWLKSAGIEVPEDSNGNPQTNVEISPLYALDENEFVEKYDGTPISDGTTF